MSHCDYRRHRLPASRIRFDTWGLKAEDRAPRDLEAWGIRSPTTDRKNDLYREVIELYDGTMITVAPCFLITDRLPLDRILSDHCTPPSPAKNGRPQLYEPTNSVDVARAR
jgi:hypothetical protein